MEQNHSIETNYHSASQEISCLLWKLKVHYCFTRSCHWFLSWAGNTMLCGSLSPQHGTSLGCGWRRWPPDIEGGCRYIE